MALTPQEIAGYRQQFGIQPSSPSAPGPSSDGLSAQDRMGIIFGKQPDAQAAEKPAGSPGYISRVLGDYSQAGKDVVSDIRTQAGGISSGLEKGGLAGAAQAAGSALRAGLHTAGTVAGAAVAPIAEAVSPVVSPVIRGIASIPGISGGVKAASDWAERHPEAAKDLGSAFNIATLGAGAEAEKPVLDAAKDVASGAKEAVASQVESMSAKAAATSAAEKEASSAAELSRLADETRGVAGKNDRIAALERTGAVGKDGKALGGAKESLLNGLEVADSPRDIERAKAVQGIVKAGESPVRNLASLNREISRISEEEVAPALEKAGATTPISEKAPGWSPIVQRLQAIEKPDLITADPVLDRTYDLVRSRMIQQIQKQEPTVKGLWEARKAFDKVVEEQYGNKVFNPDKNTALKEAIGDMRREVNSIIGERVPEYRGQMAKLSNLYDARYNIAEQYQNLVDKGGLRAFEKLSPKKAALLKWGATGTGLVAGEKILKAATGIGI